MNIEQTKKNDTLTFHLEGRLDLLSAPKLQDILIPTIDGTQSIVLDLKQLTYISSAGLRVILIAQKTASSLNVALNVNNVSDEVMEIFEMTGFSDFLVFGG
ncbi:MAG: STAS domain-containing protein [Candidatus Cloacimonetes bacterium]|nr:STAS domain-containing protein [Candidatus Cloacimonadota bacterium]